ncbi:MAG: ribulose-phosphate 3-epimerase [Anaerolineales bacterium]|jgi:ribulose-phosphate 3-epimerase|nr:ribulose-phosphate 3-epimerase [Anaerolineales bacterium]
MIKIAPSIASADQSRLGWAVQTAERAGADLIHLDIEDGVFIPNLTFGPVTIRHLRPLTDLPFDVHLEVESPEHYFAQVVEAGANIVTVQVEATRFPYRAVYQLKELGVKAGLAFNAATSLDLLPAVIEYLDVIHLMTAEPNGSAAHFLPGLLTKIEEAKEICQGRPIEIEVDGGISLDNAHKVTEAGATILVAGRAIWGSEDPVEAVPALRRAAECN